MIRVTVLDYGVGNLHSLAKAVAAAGVEVTVEQDPIAALDTDRLILPGVGAFTPAAEHLAPARDALREALLAGLPCLGICLGMQLLCEGSEEENVECLGIIPGTATRLSATTRCPVPNMGWCETNFRADDPMLRGIANDSYFYYLHSYALPVSEHTLATANHTDDFSAIVRCRNFFAAQFHPERSSASGARLLQNFLAAPI